MGHSRLVFSHLGQVALSLSFSKPLLGGFSRSLLVGFSLASNSSSAHPWSSMISSSSFPPYTLSSDSLPNGAQGYMAGSLALLHSTPTAPPSEILAAPLPGAPTLDVPELTHCSFAPSISGIPSCRQEVLPALQAHVLTSIHIFNSGVFNSVAPAASQVCISLPLHIHRPDVLCPTYIISTSLCSSLALFTHSLPNCPCHFFIF